MSHSDFHGLALTRSVVSLNSAPPAGPEGRGVGVVGGAVEQDENNLTQFRVGAFEVAGDDGER